MPLRNMAASAAQAPTSLAPTASLLADAQTAGGAAPGAAGAVAPPPPSSLLPPTASSPLLPPLLLPTKSANLASIVARVASPSAIRERIGAVYNSAISNSNANSNNPGGGGVAFPADVPSLTAALGRAQREIVRLKDEVAALLSAASARGSREGQVAVQALARARHDSVAASAAREQAGRDLASLVDGAE